ncbi:hypothetical protein BH11GEM1_BH11GEM1_32060 [soil metagenome]
MSALVDSSLVEHTWLRLGALPPSEMVKLQRQSGKLQPDLIGFVLGFTSSLSPEAIGLALYVTIVVLAMFRAACPGKQRKANDRQIMRIWTDSAAAVAASLNAPPISDPLQQLLAGSSEPAVLEYVFDAFTDMEQEEAVALSAAELERLLAVMRTFIETLHHVCQPRST